MTRSAHETIEHRFPLGEPVQLIGTRRYSNAVPGAYEIVSLLPERDGELQYRIKSEREPYYRVVREAQIEPAE